jgi:choline-glycine betaine transporter
MEIKKRKKTILTTILLTVFSGLNPRPILAQLIRREREIDNPALSERVGSLTGISFTNRFLSNIITILFIIATVIAVIYFLIGGITFITASGNKEQAVKGQDTMRSAIIGLVIIFTIYAILRLIEWVFGLKLIMIDLTPLILN